MDGVNTVTMSSTKCGLAWGDAIAATFRWRLAGRTTQVDVFFDAARTWNVYGGPLRYTGSGEVIYDLYRVALHEFGHGLGLDHPDDAGQTAPAIMPPSSWPNSGSLPGLRKIPLPIPRSRLPRDGEWVHSDSLPRWYVQGHLPTLALTLPTFSPST
jgi:hypothetical protein